MSRVDVPGNGEVQDPQLTDRQRVVFEALVHQHARTAKAVGSESLASHGRIALSPASIRNTLAELESLGLLVQGHASGGRVPSPAGYRFYVRNLVRPADLDAVLAAELDAALRRSAQDVEHLLGEASRLLSEFSKQLGVAVSPNLGGATLEGLELLPVQGRRALLMLTLRGGIVRTVVLELESPLSRDELDEVARVLRARLVGEGLDRVRALLAPDPELIRDSAGRMVMRAMLERWQAASSPALFTIGASNIAAQPEFAGNQELPSLLRVMESGVGLDRVMLEGVEGLSAVRVGVDEAEALSRCSLVSYRLPGRLGGAIGVLGPMRMDYARVLALVDRVGLRLADLM
jgi:heat-inducible transcriptional repressor